MRIATATSAVAAIPRVEDDTAAKKSIVLAVPEARGRQVGHLGNVSAKWDKWALPFRVAIPRCHSAFAAERTLGYENHCHRMLLILRSNAANLTESS